jgi:phage anti-repressor protein
MNKDSIFIKLLKKHTNIDKMFINTFFKKFKINGKLYYHIKDEDASEYLQIKLDTLRRKLISKSRRFIENIDYIKIKNDKTTGLIYMLNYPCFEKLAMSGNSDKTEVVRNYFIKIRELITRNPGIIYQSIEKQELRKIYSIYFFAADDRKLDLVKVGRTNDIMGRLRVYNTGRIHEGELKYFVLVVNPKLIEKCMKLLLLKNNQVSNNEELFNITPQKLKKIIDECFSNYVSTKEHEKLYEEAANLLGLYAYARDEIHIKLYCYKYIPSTKDEND